MAAFLLTLIAVGLTPVRLRLSLRVTKEGRVRARLAWGAAAYEFNIGAGTLSARWLAGMIRSVKDPRPLMKLPSLIRLNLNVRQVTMRCRVGVSDAAGTAVLAGALRLAFRAVCGWIVTWSARTGEADAPRIHVEATPVFNSPVFELDAGLELRARLGKFVNLGARLAIGQVSRGINRRLSSQTKSATA